MKRPGVDTEEGGGAYFESSAPVNFVSSGCALLDCALGGGFALGRISNIIGDKAVGKTLIAIETCANFFQVHPKGKVYYYEAEAAFDAPYAHALGIPVDKIKFQSGNTVEEFFSSLTKILTYETNYPALVVLDSLDALSDKAELGRGIDEGSFGAQKAKKMSELFRRLVRKVRDRQVGVMIISQVRDNIGVMFGRKTTRTGGRALDFYASQIMYLAQVDTLKKTIDKVQRPVGIVVKCKVDKNKVGLPLRDCQFTIRFGYGIDDVLSNLEWLEDIGALNSFDEGDVKKIMKRFEVLKPGEQATVRKRLALHVKKEWDRIEKDFTPTRKKYA